MTKKKSILIVAIIAVLVVAISGVSFAAWQAFIKPADQTWIVTANTPGTLSFTVDSSPSAPYNGQDTKTSTYQTSKTLTVTTTIPMTLKASVVVKVDLSGGNNYVDLPGGRVATVALTPNAPTLMANDPTRVDATVKFPDCSDPMFYGANFQIILTLGMVA